MSSKVLGEQPISLTFKFGILILLCVQNSGHALLTRYSQGIRHEKYSSTEVVLMAEVIKLVFSGYLAVVEKHETDAEGQGISRLIWLALNSRKIVILVILYSVSNLLSYFALKRVDASVYTVLLQLKTLTTPVFAVLMLGRAISAAKWRALLLLVLGCVLVASPAFNPAADPSDCALLVQQARADSLLASPSLANNGENNGEIPSLVESVLGVGAILSMVTISGYAAVYFEQMLKTSGEKLSIWERNFQLALYSMILLIVIIAAEGMNSYWSEASDSDISQKSKVGAEKMERPGESFVFLPFQGWTIFTVLICLVQAGGGLLVAATLKYADAVLKSLATSGSIVMSAVLGFALLNGQLDIFVVIGCLATILAIFNYTLDVSIQ